MSDIFRQWLADNAIGPAFQLSELQKQIGITFTVRNGTVTFSCFNATHPLAKELDGRTFTYPGWEEVKVEESKLKNKEDNGTDSL